MHSVTDRQTDGSSSLLTQYAATNGQTDGRHDDAYSRSYCVAVRSAKNLGMTRALYVRASAPEQYY